MGDELKGFEETAPTLTLEPDLGEAKQQPLQCRKQKL